MGKKIESKEELRSIQVDLLNVFHQFCMDHGIGYSLAYGTLLGSIRHQGYIPWDDDIDVCMLRSEYERFEQLFPDSLDDRYSFYTLNRNDKWNRPYGKFFNTRTIEIERARDSVLIGIGIDIFPLDDVPDDPRKFLRFRQSRLRLVQARTIKGISWSGQRKLSDNLIIMLSHLCLLPFPNRFLARVIDKYSRSNNGKGYCHIFRSCDTLVGKNSLLKSLFDSYVDVPFEGHQFKAMRGYHDYLEACYGDDYMQLPPEERRVSSHVFEAYWK